MFSAEQRHGFTATKGRQRQYTFHIFIPFFTFANKNVDLHEISIYYVHQLQLLIVIFLLQIRCFQPLGVMCIYHGHHVTFTSKNRPDIPGRCSLFWIVFHDIFSNRYQKGWCSLPCSFLMASHIYEKNTVKPVDKDNLRKYEKWPMSAGRFLILVVFHTVEPVWKTTSTE